MPARKHGRITYFIEGEGAVTQGLPSPRRAAFGLAPLAAPAPPVDTARAFRFCRMFPALAPGPDNDDGLIALGKAMDDVGPVGQNSAIPAGFTYFGQFVDHDTTFDRTQGIPSGSLAVEDIEQGRSPSLDLDSVYGRGPTESPDLYEADHTRLRVGMTTGRAVFNETGSNPNDVPRRPPAPGDPADRQAIIGDPRNDENLVVAQTHVSFLKFHNKVVDALGIAPAGSRFDMARKIVIQHYQSVVLHDFARRISDPAVHGDVMLNGRKFFNPGPIAEGDHPPMPIEFSAAAYRLGHSMVRNAYQWNKIFNTGGLFGNVVSLRLLFKFSKVSGDLQGSDTLPTDWIADFNRLYDFSERPGGVRHPQLNFARLIDTSIANGLKDLPEFANVTEDHLRFLAVRNLLRGRLLGLPSGQDVANAIGTTPLTEVEIASGPQATLLASLDFHKSTPLWYYILKEAEVQRGGQSLGAVGSRIVVETFHALVEGSQHSILKESGWKPTLPAIDPARFQMTDLLTFVNDINPLG